MANKENLQKALDVFPEKLVGCRYYSATAECYCVLGHMMQVAGIDVKEKLSDENESSFMDLDDSTISERLVEFYGLSANQLEYLQRVNDNTGEEDHSFINNEERATVLKQKLQEFLD